MTQAGAQCGRTGPDLPSGHLFGNATPGILFVFMLGRGDPSPASHSHDSVQVLHAQGISTPHIGKFGTSRVTAPAGAVTPRAPLGPPPPIVLSSVPERDPVTHRKPGHQVRPTHCPGPGATHTGRGQAGYPRAGTGNPGSRLLVRWLFFFLVCVLFFHGGSAQTLDINFQTLVDTDSRLPTASGGLPVGRAAFPVGLSAPGGSCSSKGHPRSSFEVYFYSLNLLGASF